MSEPEPDDNQVEWPEPADDPNDEPTEPWAKEGEESGGAETDTDPES